MTETSSDPTEAGSTGNCEVDDSRVGGSSGVVPNDTDGNGAKGNPDTIAKGVMPL